MNNKYAIFYKTDKNSYWQSKRLDLSIEQWENYCKEQNYAQYKIKDLSTYSADDLHLLTDVVNFNDRYYLPEEKIEYPDSIPADIKNFKIDMVMDEEYANDEIDFDEVYNKQSICWNFGYLWTEITTKFIFSEKTAALALIAQEIVKNLPEFTEKLEKNSYAVYINMEFSKFKWLAWIKEDKVRLIHQTYQEENPVTEFDVLVDKTWFFSFCEDMIKTMKDYADKDLERYNEYVKGKYGDNNAGNTR